MIYTPRQSKASNFAIPLPIPWNPKLKWNESKTNINKWQNFRLLLYLWATKERDRLEQFLVRISLSDPSLHSATDRRMESTFLPNSGAHHRADSGSDLGSRTKAELRRGSWQASSHDLQTSIARHRWSKVRREMMLVRHSRVNSAQSDLDSGGGDSSLMVWSISTTTCLNWGTSVKSSYTWKPGLRALPRSHSAACFYSRRCLLLLFYIFHNFYDKTNFVNRKIVVFEDF